MQDKIEIKVKVDPPRRLLLLRKSVLWHANIAYGGVKNGFHLIRINGTDTHRQLIQNAANAKRC